MSEYNNGKLVDILPLIEPQQALEPQDFVLYAVIALLIVAVLLAILSRSRRVSLMVLRKRIRQHQIDPRTAAHRLAKFTRDDVTLNTHLQSLRFARNPPSAAQLLDFLRKIT